MSSPPSLLSFLTPSQALFPSEEYDGYQFRWKNFVFRPAEFKYEGLALIAVIAYFALYLFGKRLNEKRAGRWFGAHYPIYEIQFSKPVTGSALLSDGASDFFVYSTGRRGVHYMHTLFTMLPRHDIFQIIFQKLYGLTDLNYAPKDEVLLDIKLRDKDGLNGEGKGFVWGVVSKNEMQALRKQRWDVEVVNLADVVDQKHGFKIETYKKLKKSRVDLDIELQKEADKEKRDEAEEKKAAEKRKAAEERLARLSAAEQKKHEERERKKAIKKSQSKVVRK
ncbi:hypothetical protein FRC09_002948 [Ceratobasidium sp. 395]|nr:hypothetical protein FRC09_002948 [Ceratobasidium sp. 395]